MTSDQINSVSQVMPEAFRKLLTSHATHRWQTEIQEGILLMCELFIELLTTRMQYDPVPCHMLNTLALIFDTKNDWNHKNKDQGARGRWHTATGTTARFEEKKIPLATGLSMQRLLKHQIRTTANSTAGFVT